MSIQPNPTKPPAFDPNDERYWDARDLESEIHRVFEICHGCRMCVSYCGSFPSLFDMVDRDIETKGAVGAEQLNADDFAKVTELCWQCKLCYIDCPYTPDQGHAWLLDFPRLLMREKAQRARRNGVTMQDAALGEPGQLGQLGGGPLAPLMNFVNTQRLLRKVNEKVLGISAEFPLPPFAARPFEKWLAKHKKQPNAGREGDVAIFATCLADYNFPRIGAAATTVLEHNGWNVVRPEQWCCGLPNLDGGDVEEAKAKAKKNVASLKAALDAGAQAIVCPGASCAYTIKKEWPELVGTADAAYVASKTQDLMQFLDGLRKDKKLDREFKKGFGKIGYHAPCHLRAQKIGVPGARLLGLLPNTEVKVIEKCSAVDGTWGMKAQHYEMGRKYAGKLIRGVEDAEAELLVSDCPLSGLRILKETGTAPIHPVEALCQGYGLDPSA